MISDDATVIKPTLAALQKSFRSGKTLPIEYRKQQLKSLARGIKELESKFFDALKKDLGMNEIMAKMLSTNITLDEISLILKDLDHWTKPESVDLPLLVGPGKSYIKPEPFGVALIISPWNYPVSTCLPYVATAIAAGNCVVLKPSEVAPYTSKVLSEVFEKYLDRECFRCIEGQVEVAKAIIKEPFDVIVFTGSTEKGKLVAKAAAEHLTPCILELGGKSPTIVDRNADLDNAAFRIMQGRFINCGQTCIACDYLFVHKDIKQKLMEKFKQKLIEFYGTDPAKSTDYSRIINEFHLKRLKSYLDEDHGGKVLVGGQVNMSERYLAPTIVDTPKLTSKMMQEEIFGPILPVYEFDDFDYVINFIKDRPKPLALYYYGSGSSANYKRLRDETSSGGLSLNESVFHFGVLEAPFGGVGFSGFGKLHGHYGFKALSHPKSVLEKGTINSFPFNVRFPPHDGTSRKKILNFMLQFSTVTQGFVNKIVLLIILFIVLMFLFRRGHLNVVTQTVENVVNGVLGSAKGKDL